MTHGKTYNKSPRRINHKATKSKTNTGTTALERSIEQTTGGFKALLQLANFTLGPDATLNTEIHKNSVRIKAPNSVNASKRKHKNQVRFRVKSANYYGSYGSFSTFFLFIFLFYFIFFFFFFFFFIIFFILFYFYFLQNACFQMTPGRGHTCHTDTFLVLRRFKTFLNCKKGW